MPLIWLALSKAIFFDLEIQFVWYSIATLWTRFKRFLKVTSSLQRKLDFQRFLCWNFFMKKKDKNEGSIFTAKTNQNATSQWYFLHGKKIRVRFNILRRKILCNETFLIYRYNVCEMRTRWKKCFVKHDKETGNCTRRSFSSNEFVSVNLYERTICVFIQSMKEARLLILNYSNLDHADAFLYP